MGFFEGNPRSISTTQQTPQLYTQGPVVNGKRLGILGKPVPTKISAKVKGIVPNNFLFGDPHSVQPLFVKIPKPTKEQKIGFGIIEAQRITKAREERYANIGGEPANNVRVQGPLDRAFIRNEINGIRREVAEQVKTIRSRGRGRPPNVPPPPPVEPMDIYETPPKAIKRGLDEKPIPPAKRFAVEKKNPKKRKAKDSTPIVQVKKKVKIAKPTQGIKRKATEPTPIVQVKKKPKAKQETLQRKRPAKLKKETAKKVIKLSDNKVAVIE